MKPALIFLSLLSITGLSAQEPAKEAKPAASAFPDLPDVERAMKKAAAFYRRELSVAGGYAWQWPQDISIAKGENRDGTALIMIQPPGTPSIGLVFVKAWEATKDPLYLQGAREAAQALMWCQLSSGGWDSDFDFDPRKARKYHFRRDLESGDTERAGRHGDSTLDDQKTQSALLFLLELAALPESKDDRPLQHALKFGFDGLLAAQAPNGGWGQHYDGPADASAPVVKSKIPAQWSRTWPGTDYTKHYTLNDGNIQQAIRLLLRAHELTKEDRYLSAAKKAGDFLLLARLPQPQPAWAQQYNRDMEPVWARKFEPPSISSTESFGALEGLHELWVVTGDDKYMQPHQEVIAWLEKSKLPDGQWARFYELGTNKALYCVAETYELTYEDKNLPTHYGFKIEDLGKDLAKLKEKLAQPREDLLRKRADPTEDKKWASAAKGAADKVRKALAAADSKRGCWLKDDMIDSREFVKHMNAMIYYLRAARNAGTEFEKLRDAAKAR